MVSVAYRICLKKKKKSKCWQIRKKKCANSNNRWSEYPKRTVHPSNKYACILPLHRILKSSSEGCFFFLKWAREFFENMTWQKYFQLSQGREAEFLLRLTRRQHVRNNGNGGGEEGWVKSIKHPTLIFCMSHRSICKKNKNKNNEKRHPIVFGFKAGLR